MIEWLTTTLRFDRTVGKAEPAAVEMVPPQDLRDGWRRSSRRFAEAQDIDQLYAAARAAGEVSALDQQDPDRAFATLRPAAGFDA